jgi:hypothetical protein
LKGWAENLFNGSGGKNLFDPRGGTAYGMPMNLLTATVEEGSPEAVPTTAPTSKTTVGDGLPNTLGARRATK